MKIHATRIAGLGLLCSVLSLSAQEDQQTVFELSPFEVSTSGDAGYLATNAITGARVNTAIRDLPVQMSVLTRELLDDLNVSPA